MVLYGEISELEMFDSIEKDMTKSFRDECNCLPACTTIVYNADIDRAKLNYREAQKARNNSFFLSEG